MNERSHRNSRRFGAEFVNLPCALANISSVEPGKAVKMPSGAIYARQGASLIRINRQRGSKKERRRQRAAAKAAEKLPIEQLQAELAGEGA